jgi:hypothetical protein
MAYTTIDKSSLHFNTKLYTGTASSNALTGINFQPDWVWIKRRDGTYNHNLYDAVRGVTKEINSNNNNAESTVAQGLTAFGTDGFTLGSDDQSNASGDTFVAWNWKAGTGQGSSNTDGTINTTYTSANTTAGFSIIKYTGSGSAGTVGHGLGVTPDLTIRKKISTTGDWFVHTTLIDSSLDFLKLNTTDAKSNSSLTGFTSSTIGVDGDSSQEILYVFAQKKGYSKFGTYTGNGNADGAFIYTGFKPGWIMIKRYDAGTEDWNMWDSKRIGYNISGNDKLYANLNSAELTTENAIDILSNGFKLRSTNGGFNGSGSTYIYMAFAEAPLVTSGNIPATAR